MINAIFFDFNGVIIDDETIQMKAYQEVLRGHDIDLKEEWYFDALGMDDRTFVRAMFDRAKKPLTDQVWQSVLAAKTRSEEHTSELQSLAYLVCRLLLEKKKKKNTTPKNRLH